jgi:hypothetical protein
LAAISHTCAPCQHLSAWLFADANAEDHQALPRGTRQRRDTVEHPFGTIKMRMGATHFLMKRLPRVATEMALHVLAYNLTRVLNIIGIKPMMTAVGA